MIVIVERWISKSGVTTYTAQEFRQSEFVGALIEWQSILQNEKGNDCFRTSRQSSIYVGI